MAYPAPTGRELAIEALLDREPHGDAYRVSRVLEEVVPMALHNRPNRVTVPALVEEAFSLQNNSLTPARPMMQRSVVEERVRSALLDYHTRLTKDRLQQQSSIPERWMGWLQTVWRAADRKSSSAAPGLKELRERLSRGKETSIEIDEAEEETNPMELTMEQFMGKLLPILTDDDEETHQTGTADRVAALWLVVTLLLSSESSNPIQCGHLLSGLMFQKEASQNEAFQLDSEVLTYLGEAAAVCQERWLAQKPAAEPNNESEEAPASPTAAASVEEPTASSPVVVMQTVSAPTSDEGVPGVAVEEAGEVAEPQEPVAANVVRPDSSDSSSDSESSESDSESSSSDSSEGEARRAELFVESERSVDDETEDNGDPGLMNREDENEGDNGEDEEEDDYDTLRQALAIAVSEEPVSISAVRVVVNGTSDETEEEPLAETPVSEGPTEFTDDFPDDEVEEENFEETQVELPAFPPAPDQAPFSEHDVNLTGDDAEVNWQAVYDPSDENHFAALPRSHILVHLLRYAEAVLGVNIAANTEDEKASSLPTAPGGMGAFLYNVGSVWDGDAVARTTSALASDQSSSVLIFQLITTTLVTLCTNRRETLKQLRQTIEREQRAMQGDIMTQDDDEGHPLGDQDEEDDPAMAFAMSHVEDDDAPLSVEVLENKGMRRKAAAAAHDAASLLRTLRKQKGDLRALLLLDSTCILSVLRSFRHFVRILLEDWITEQESSQDGIRDSIPDSVRIQVLRSLDGLMDVTELTLPESWSDDQDPNDVTLGLDLYKEATLAWGEAVPHLYDKIEDQVKLLLTLLREIDSSLPEDRKDFESVDSLSILPTKSTQCKVHRLQVLSRRLQFGDVLNQLVSVPIPWLNTEENALIRSNRMLLPTEVRFPQQLLRSLRGALENMDSGKLDVEQLYMALCHRIHTKILLFDGLYAIAKTDTSSLAPMISPTKKNLDASTIHVHSTPVSRLQFDATKCADSIAIVPGTDSASAAGNGPSVNQRASKVWGAVLSAQYFTPKSGVHRWGIKLDRCERGHVFIGVSTSQASVRTYVGGDKHGWGMIGTQALWHDRRKVRGDYGGTFRTGSTIIVTLDTDAGTLSFGSWKNMQGNANASSDPLVHNLLSPRRQGIETGNFEDWGIAFEGLPLDARLFPAVGLYQRDDKVTILPVDNGSYSSGGSIASLGGVCFFPGVSDDLADERKNECERLRQHNEELLSETIVYAEETLDYELRKVSAGSVSPHSYSVLGSLLASLSLLPPSVPLLSMRCALSILPKVGACIDTLRNSAVDTDGDSRVPNLEIIPGEWIIRASSGSDLEEYRVTLTRVKNDSGEHVGFEGSGRGTSGKSKNGHVVIGGSLNGTSVVFVEDWTDEKAKTLNTSQGSDVSACVVRARMALDGMKFEGSYKNVDFASGGQIVGYCLTPTAEKNSAEAVWSMRRALLLSSALVRLATIIVDDVPRDFARAGIEASKKDVIQVLEKKDGLRDILLRRFLASACFTHDFDPTDSCVRALDDLFSFDHPSGCGSNLVKALFVNSGIDDFPADKELTSGTFASATRVDTIMVPLSGGRGSLRLLCPAEYDSARVSIVSALVHHAGYTDEVNSVDSESNASEGLKDVWRKSLQVMENGIRSALSKHNCTKGEASRTVCKTFQSLSDFLMKLRPCSVFSSSDDCINEVCMLYQAVDDADDVDVIIAALTQSTLKSTLSLTGVLGVSRFLSISGDLGMSMVEGNIAGLSKIFGDSRSRRLLSHEIIPPPLQLGQSESSPPICLSVKVRACLEEHMRKSLKTLIPNLGRLSHADQSSTKDSLHLSILATFASTFGCDQSDITVDLLKEISSVLSDYRAGAVDVTPESFGCSVVETVRLTVDRDISRAILRSATAVAHAVVFAISTQTTHQENKNPTINMANEWLREELEILIPFMEDSFQTELTGFVQECSDVEWNRWKDTALGATKKNTLPDRKKGSKPGLQFFWEHGTLTTPQGPGKDGSRDRLPTKEASQNIQRRLESGFRNRHLAHWLHVLCAVLRSPNSAKYFCHESNWLRLLLKSVGLDCIFQANVLVSVSLRPHDKGLLPARHRSRIMSLLYHYLSHVPPSKSIVEGLFGLAGASVVSSGMDDEERVSREAISLLRKLHTPKHSVWRDQINELLPSLVDSASLAKKAGVRAMLGGSLIHVGPLCRVLLRPAAASALSRDSYASPQMKAQGSFATAHLPAGAEHVVAGLLRYTAEGGIVSSVDEKTGICEVILTPRRNAAKDNGTDGKGKGFRKNLTVRALRTQSTDLVAAEEEALVIDEAVPSVKLLKSMLRNSLDSLLSATSDSLASLAGPLSSEKERNEEVLGREGADRGEVQVETEVEDYAVSPEESGSVSKDGNGNSDSVHCSDVDPPGNPGLESIQKGILGLTLDLMTLKCCITLLSDGRIIDEFLKMDGSASTLGRLLTLAWPERSDGSPMAKILRSIRGTSISWLCWYEAKYSLLVSSIKEINFRSQSLQIAEPVVWRARAGDITIGSGTETKKLAQSPSIPDPTPVPRAQSSGPAGAPAATQSQQRNSGQASVGSNNSEDDEDQEHLREAAIVQMAELGIPRPYAELALRRVGGTNIEAAVHFCLEHEAEIERLLAEEMGRRASGRDGGSGREAPDNSHLLNQLLEMGFRRRWCVEALASTGNNVDEALTWILTNTEMLENMYNSEEEGEENAEEEEEEEEEEESDEEDTDEGESPPDGQPEENESEAEPVSKDWSLSVVPLRLISGKATIDPKTLEVTGQPNGGFASVGMKGVLLQSGKWYYEVLLGTAGCIQVGFADSSFAGHCNAERGDGCGDSSSSFSFDGWRRLRWHASATEWGCRWQEGDVIGCLVDIDERQISFTINGQGEEVGMGVAFSNFDFCGGLYPVVSFNRKESVRLILGGSGEPFKNSPPSGFLGVGEALPDRINERAAFLRKEAAVRESVSTDDLNGFLCDYSDEDHGHELFSWSHRYYGSDASVHLGSIRSKHGGNRPTRSSDDTPTSLIDQRLKSFWTEHWSGTDDKGGIDGASLVSHILKGFVSTQKEAAVEVFNQSLSLGLTLARKLLLHVIVACKSFDPRELFSAPGSEETNMVRLVKILEVCVGARNWTGEASAMAMAAESLGLGVQMQARRIGPGDASDLSLHRTGFCQVLSSIQHFNDGSISDTSSLVAAAAEGSFSSDSTAALTFLRANLQQAATSSAAFREAVLATARRGIRLLALVDDSESRQRTNDEDDGTAENNDPQDDDDRAETTDGSPDAKLVSFFTGLLLSITGTKTDCRLHEELFSAWSIGLLSASLPWRMICAQTCAAILNLQPSVLAPVLRDSNTLARYFGRLPSTVVRRVWAERAAVPVCSRYVQAMIELLCAVRRSKNASPTLPHEFLRFWEKVDVEASCPRPLSPSLDFSVSSHPLDTNGIMMIKEDVWTGSLEYDEVHWKKPARSTVRTLMDGGEGPPMVRAGCLVMRGPDWEKTEENTNIDGYEQYESEKTARSKVIKSSSQSTSQTEHKEGEADIKGDGDDPTNRNDSGKKKRKKPPHPKLPVGTVVSIEPWNGIAALGRRVRWSLTGKEGIYRFGGDGGKFDIMHVETNQKRTKVVKKYPFPETAEQSASRRGFGMTKAFAAILRLPAKKRETSIVRGVLELPDFGAGLEVDCEFHDAKSVTITERCVLYGQKDAGWEARFGQPSYVPGTKYVLRAESRTEKDESRRDPLIEELVGSTTFDAAAVKNPADGTSIQATSRLKVHRFQPSVVNKLETGSGSPPSLAFDRQFHASNMSVSQDQRTVVCSSSDGRGCAFVSTGFSKGVHYWEVSLGQVSESGSVFIGCAEKPPESPPRLNRWLGWGFVNFRATYSGGSERVYGVHAHTGDVIGVLLDCDAGRLSFFYDGLKYGEHIISDLGCAYENLAPFGFSAEGCGTGGHGQAAPNGFLRTAAQGFVKPRTLFPVIGLKNHGDRVTLSPMWSTTYGVDGASTLRNVLAVEDLLHNYGKNNDFTGWFLREAYTEYEKWRRCSTKEIVSRGSRPYRIDLDISPHGCAQACSMLGLDHVLLPGDRVRLKRSFGRVLELAEDAIILGQNQLRLYYRIVAQKNEGQSLSEGAYLPHYLQEFDVVDGVEFLAPPKGKEIPLPRLDRFRCISKEGLKVVFPGGAIIRSDLEITDSSQNLGSIPCGALIPQDDVFDRRVNSCGILRYKVRHEGVVGFISARIQGGSEEAIVVQAEANPEPAYPCPSSCASAWCKEWSTAEQVSLEEEEYVNEIQNFDDFISFHGKPALEGLDVSELDSLLAETLCVISNFTDSGDALECSFREVIESFAYARRIAGQEEVVKVDTVSTPIKQAVATLFASKRFGNGIPPIPVLVARASSIRAFNRRARYALPWLTIRPGQEGSSILGGCFGTGCSVDRAGRSWKAGESRDVSWVEPLSVGKRVRNLRRLILANVKREFLGDVTLATTTPTPLSHDEYELPREIRTVRINRMRAARALQSAEKTIKRKYSVFAQLQSETRNLGGAALRRGFVAKGHGGQKRAFRVKLVGEGVNDYSGPYREVFTDAFAEITKTDTDGLGVLGVLDATPNRAAGIGEKRDLFMFSLNGQQLESVRKDFETGGVSDEESMIREQFASLIAPRNEASREVEDALVFLGRLTGTAYRHGIPVDLPLGMESVWKAMVEEKPENKNVRLSELDLLAARSERGFGLLWWQQRMLNAFVDGFGNVIPVELLPLLTAEELRDTICGSPDVDVDLLKSVVEYEGFTQEDKVVEYFWTTLREATNAERRNFLQYVWARSRLPLRASDFESPFKILRDSNNTAERADQALPSASTCFFSLTLPEYSSAEVLKEKLMYAITNVTTMETDFQTNSAEIAEGYRTL